MNYIENENCVVLSKKEIKSCRHKAERRWYRRLVFLNLLMVIIVVGSCIGNFDKNIKRANEEILTFQEYLKSTEETETPLFNEEIPVEVKWLFIGVIMLVAFPFAINVLYAASRAKAIKITNRNFPEIYDIIIEHSKKLRLKKVPEVYVAQENGLMNAFAAFIIRKQYIQINADLFEIAYREHQDIDSISFIIAHELSHIKLRHATLWYNLPILYASGLPIFGSTASRAREYSCDRLAQKLTGIDGVDAMMALMAGKHLYKRVDVEDYIESTKNVKGFFVWCYNLGASHPIMTKRIRALIAREGSGKLY